MKAIVNKVPTKQECLASVNAIRDALFVLNGKWKLPLIFSLLEKSQRFNEIQHAITGISSKILAKELKDLELNDFIIRNVYPTTPVSIIYEATEYSRTLKNVMGELNTWGEQHREKVRQSMRTQS